MQDGYIAEDGTYNTGSPGLFGSPVLVREGDEDFAEVVSGSAEELFMYGRTHSEVFRDFTSQLTTPQAIAQFGHGFISYPDDIRWFLYGVAAWANLLGPEAKDRNTQTIDRFTEVVIGDGSPSFKARSTVLFGAYLNHTVMRNLAGFSGRVAGGFVIKLVMQIALNRYGVGFLHPDSWVPSRTPFFLKPMFLLVSVGSVVRLAEKHFDQYGNLNSMSLTDILVSATTGQDIPGEGARFSRQTGASLAQQLESSLMFCQADIREANDISFGEGTVSADRIESEIRGMESDAFTIGSRLRYASNDDDFYNAIVSAHNLAIQARQMGCQAEGLETFINLMDPTVALCLDLFLEGVNAVLMSQSGHYEYWEVFMRDLARLETLNTPGLVVED
ncbi:hypothetical protein [Tateyamaria sp. SN6-1]|uniref:hypothetical protein n=1 Tax=Tateyamaria sp. SN6-1 TaxID=3092148 RepID=UPI0039F4FE60